MNNKSSIIRAPRKKELLTLRIMIFIGLLTLCFFFYILLKPENIGHPLFYWILISTIFFSCLQIVHEWYHYFSISVPDPPVSDKKYTVDIFTTFCAGEPYSMITETLEAIQRITYPHETYLGDEANDPFLIEECKRLGVHHVTRTNRKNAKAGNINNMLEQSHGELCLVLDPDHIPTPDFLDHVAGHFADPEVGFVQIVQAYYNVRENLIAKGAAQQTFQFYGPMMMTMNSYGTTMAIGANCTFRRTALESIGGHAAGLAEDMHTAMQLHARGWKSKYVPAVLTRGLVPSSLSAYYKQQLKWSRGVFELLVTSYPKLFSKFTWRQKLHYGTIPFHYFSGIIYFLNFLIPILSLVLDIIPFRIDMFDFAFASIPFVISTLMIRHYVQRWVTEERERGFHIVGGLLLIGTWWIYILGFVFTLIRRKVPYDPTPKDGSDPNNWGLNIPNILVGICSLAAIAYGLYIDYTPYSIVMACIAGLNCLFMGFVVFASRQTNFRRFKRKNPKFNATVNFVLPIKGILYDWRHKLYRVFRKLALPIIAIFACTSFYYSRNPPDINHLTEDRHLPPAKDFLLKGIFAPVSGTGLSSVRYVNQIEEQTSCNMNIISLYLAWGEESQNEFPAGLLDSVYRNGSLLMITWEPWGGLFHSMSPEIRTEHKILDKIHEGVFDQYIAQSARKLKQLGQPVFLRFAHEPDNPAYPWSSTGGNTPESYRKAWIHVRKLFQKEGAFNVIWVWNPWKPEAAEAYFPGDDEVDWIGLTILNYGRYNDDKTSYSFRELLSPFAATKLFSKELPVMIAEMGSLEEKGKWHHEAFNSMLKGNSPIRAAVFFNNAFDHNVPGYQTTYLDWTIKDFKSLSKHLVTRKKYETSQYFHSIRLDTSSSDKVNTPQLPVCRGINYSKGQYWFRNFHTLTRREIDDDLKKIKSLGFNTIKVFGPGVYDRNILKAASEWGLKVVYTFNIPKGMSFLDDSTRALELKEEIISAFKDNRDQEAIIAWNVSSDALEDANRRFHKPASLYHRNAYIIWLKDLCREILANDTERPFTVDVEYYRGLKEDLSVLQYAVPSISAFGINVSSDSTDIKDLKTLSVPFFLSKVRPEVYSRNTSISLTAFISDWQDTWSANRVTFDGITDHWGRRKKAYYSAASLWSTSYKKPASFIPEIRILKSAVPTYPGEELTYNALVNIDKNWKLAADASEKGLEFEWRLIRADTTGKPKELIEAGKGPVLRLKIPPDPHLYRLYLVAFTENESRSVTETLVLWPEEASDRKK